MNQYSRQRASLLRPKPTKESSARIINNMVEMEINGERVVVPTAEAYQNLLKKVAILEQRLYTTDNKANRAVRKNNNE
jgi:hypothetical protein